MSMGLFVAETIYQAHMLHMHNRPVESKAPPRHSPAKVSTHRPENIGDTAYLPMTQALSVDEKLSRLVEVALAKRWQSSFVCYNDYFKPSSML